MVTKDNATQHKRIMKIGLVSSISTGKVNQRQEIVRFSGIETTEA